MTILASYTRTLIILSVLFIAGCGTQQVVNDTATSITPADSEKALKSTTEGDVLAYRQALTHLNNNKLDDARSLLKDFIDDHPSLAGPWANMGLIFIKEGKLDKATEALDKALKLNPKLAQAHNLRGYIENKKRNFLQAEKFYKAAIEINSSYSIAHYNLALLYDIYLQDIAKAVQHYKIYLKITENKDKKTMDWVQQLSSTLKKS
ncbi:MAG: tetratricopeptide repeat protein [Gammaproteobacteria bacterium]|nr:tetratricopeptide repeat protein [Gammaproteobacteria bacterium]